MTSEEKIFENIKTFPKSLNLWQFLLRLLCDPKCQSLISWCGENGEFKLITPEKIAKMWGCYKNNLSMNYGKLSRALRYYYENVDKDEKIISKIWGRNFTYKFEFDLRENLGYDSLQMMQFNDSFKQL